MTVSELITRLVECDKDLPVVIVTEDGDEYDIDSIEVPSIGNEVVALFQAKHHRSWTNED